MVIKWKLNGIGTEIKCKFNGIKLEMEMDTKWEWRGNEMQMGRDGWV